MIYEFRGRADERGRQHGARLREQIHARIARSVAASLPAIGARRDLAQPWLRAIDALDRRVLGAELRGIAAGAGADLHDIVLLNSFEAFDLARQVELGGCTAMALAGPSGTVVGQNWDANPSLAASVAVHLHRGPDIPPTVLLASPGGLGWIGMNGHGVALVNNDLLTRAVRPGVPSQAIRRHALQGRSADDAVRVIVSTPAVGGRAYLLADARGGLATIEVGAEAGPSVTHHAERAAHTNHALDPVIAAHEDTSLLAAVYPSSRSRLRRAVELLERADARPQVVSRAILVDHEHYPLSICRHRSDREPTVTSASVVLDCYRRRASITLGLACTGERFDISLAH